MLLKKPNLHFKFTKFILLEPYSGLITNNYLMIKKEQLLESNHQRGHKNKLLHNILKLKSLDQHSHFSLLRIL